MKRTMRLTGTTAAHSSRSLPAWIMVMVGLALGQADTARAASFTVNPIQVFLSASTRSALVTVKNETDQPLRFQLSVVAWNQEPNGQMQLAPTQDVVFFPPLLTLKAKEERKIRVGVTVPPGTAEKTYRLFVEELPPTETQSATNGVQMLTKMGIPIFLQPTKVVARAVLKELNVKAGRFSFQLQNEGTVHFIPLSVRVLGLDGSGLKVFEDKPYIWYVLAGGVRSFDMALPQDACAQVRSLVIETQLTENTVKETLQAPAGVCAK